MIAAHRDNKTILIEICDLLRIKYNIQMITSSVDNHKKSIKRTKHREREREKKPDFFNLPNSRNAPFALLPNTMLSMIPG